MPRGRPSPLELWHVVFLAIFNSSAALKFRRTGFWHHTNETNRLTKSLNFIFVEHADDFRTLGDLRSSAPVSSTSMVHSQVPAAIHFRGNKNVDAIQFFAEALTQQLPKSVLESLNQCQPPMLSVYDDRYRDEASAARSYAEAWQRQSRPVLWVIVNTEDMSGAETLTQAVEHMGKHDHAVFLTNMFSDKEEAMKSDQYSTFWVPGASLMFAQRKFHTPLDLVHRDRVRFNHERRGSVAYQFNQCFGPRESVFRHLFGQLQDRGHMPPSALGSCSGGLPRARAPVPAPDGGCPGGTRFDQSVCRYEHFLFTLSLEHKQSSNVVGYMSEKIVDGFLAGAVPIYAGASQVDTMFNPAAFVHANVSNEYDRRMTAVKVVDLLEDWPRYQKMRHLQPLISNETLRKYFSWHPAVWTTHGDELKWQILAELLRHCSRIAMETRRPHLSQTTP
mmetsp:Transcript_22008/g.63453  ORF Transcript_22008/g.63453 Transcript_22008/m.63453 type:complete len:447 (-) Transcript_22008:328-1668(-)